MKAYRGRYELRCVNRRYRTPIRYTRLGMTLQLIALWVAAVLVAMELFR